VAGYEERAGHYWKLETEEVDAGSGGSGEGAEAVRGVEGDRLLARIPAGAEVVALTRAGKALGSRELARWMEERAVYRSREVVFVLGGAFGLGGDVLNRASLRLSLSSMTLPHEVARLVLAEQLYRTGTLLRGEPYHKGP
jgi:23S rRNA (pseudouridine1915-N3)-methyltransferase